MSTIFVSHVSEVSQLASVLKRWVEKAFVEQVTAFVSGDDIRSGEQWFRRLEKELGDAEVVLVLCTEKSLSTTWVNFEAGFGHAIGVRIVPIIYDSSLTVDSLPIPYGLFSALDARDDEFARQLLIDLAKYLKFGEPDIRYEQMTAEVRQALPGEQAERGQEEEDGFLDHVAASGILMDKLTELLKVLGTDANNFTSETEAFNHLTGRPAQSPQSLRRHARNYGTALFAYSDKLKEWNRNCAEILPQINKRFQYIIAFQDPQTAEDREVVRQFVSNISEANNSIESLSNVISTTRKTMDKIPDIQREMTRGVRIVAQQYDGVIQNLDDTSIVLVRIMRDASSKLGEDATTLA